MKGYHFFILIGVWACSATANAQADGRRLAEAALERTNHAVRYDGAYFSIEYPGGDVPPDTGVCTDVLIRALRTLGVDLQRLVHEDMAANFSAYPASRIWGQSRPDRNIDHRRVPNLRVFFSRHGYELPTAGNADDFRPGDIVSWQLPGNLPHIGIVSLRRHRDSGRLMVVHNIGAGPKLEDVLFAYKMTGHYRYLPESLP